MAKLIMDSRLVDVDGAALTYADVRAIASGNPLFIEKANVDAELARLNRLCTQHPEAGYRMRSQTRTLGEEIPRLERRIAALEANLERRRDTRGDRFAITLGTRELNDRGIAAEMLIRVAERSKSLTAERLSYSGLAPLLAERVLVCEEAIVGEVFAGWPLDEQLLLELHRRICGDLVRDWAGRRRTVEIQVGNLRPPALINLNQRLPKCG